MKLPSSEQVQINALAEVVGELRRRVHCLEKAHAEAGHSEWDKPAETWRDVSSEFCSLTCGDAIDLDAYPGYRLRKVTIRDGNVQYGKDGTYRHAFIIEKREGA